MTSTPGLCLVGTGAIATDHMIAFDRLGAKHRPWVVSRRLEAAEVFAREWHFDRSTTRLETALQDARVSLVIISSPSDVHADQAAMALRAGKDVIVEIPAGLTLADIENLFRISNEAKRRLFVCHTMRSFPALREIKRRVDAGEMNVAQIQGFFAVPRRSNQGWAGPRSWVDSILWHHACHQVDASLWVLGADSISESGMLEGEVHSDLPMLMDLSLSFRCGEVVVTHALTYNSDQLLWELRFIGRHDLVVFRNGTLLNESGDEIVPVHSIRDLETQDREILHALSAEEGSSFDIEAVLPAYRALHQIDRTPTTPVR